jgi:hypothetical protein
MESRRSSDGFFAALVAVTLLLLTAWGNAFGLLVAAAAGLVVGWVFLRPRDGRHVALAALTGAVVAALIIIVAKHLH